MNELPIHQIHTILTYSTSLSKCFLLMSNSLWNWQKDMSRITSKSWQKVKLCSLFKKHLPPPKILRLYNISEICPKQLLLNNKVWREKLTFSAKSSLILLAWTLNFMSWDSRATHRSFQSTGPSVSESSAIFILETKAFKQRNTH